METKEDLYEYNNCPIRVSFFVEFNLSDLAITEHNSNGNYLLKFETSKNSISEPIKDTQNGKRIVEKIKEIDVPDDHQVSQRISNKDKNILKYFINNLELDFSVPKLFRILLITSENESPEYIYQFYLVDLFLHAYDEINFKSKDIFFNELVTASVYFKGIIATPVDKTKKVITIRFMQNIKYAQSPNESKTFYVTQDISKFVKNTTSYDVTVRRHDFGFFDSLFYKPYTQLVVFCQIGNDAKKPKYIYHSPIFVNALYFKIDTFNILTSKYVNSNGVPLEQTFTLLDWTHKKPKEIFTELIQKSDSNKDQSDYQADKNEYELDEIEVPIPTTKKEDEQKLIQNKDVKKKKKKDEKKYFSVEKRDISERTFVQLLCLGVRIQTIIAIDFSSSNRPVLIKDSRHSGDSNTNLYLGAINTIFDTLAVYDENYSVSLYGLCAKIKGVFHEYFPITKRSRETIDDDTSIETDNKYSSKESMEDAYNYYRQMLQFWGPTKLSNFLCHAKEKANNALNQSKSKNIYTVVTIITDGLIVDLRDIADTVSKMTKDPIFIVFVGIGEEKSDRGFLSLKQIDDNLNQMKNSDDGEVALHDIVKFAHFKTENLVEKSSFSKLLFNDIPDEVARFMNQKNNKED